MHPHWPKSHTSVLAKWFRVFRFRVFIIIIARYWVTRYVHQQRTHTESRKKRTPLELAVVARLLQGGTM